MIFRIDELIESLSNIKKLFLEIEKEENILQEREIEIINFFIKELKPVFRYIHQKFIISNDEFYNGNSFQGKIDYNEDKGILIKENIEDYNEDKWNGTRKGYHIYLIENKIVFFLRTGYYSAWGNTCSPFHLVNEKIIKENEWLKYFSLNQFICSISDYFQKAIEENKNKKPMLEKRIDLINNFKSKYIIE